MINRIINLHTNKLNLSHLAILSDEGILEKLEGHTLYKQLERGGYIFNGKVSEKGLELLSIVDNPVNYKSPNRSKNKVQVEYSEDFLKWWEAYPPTDNFTYRGIDYIGTRTLRLKKEECFTEYIKLSEEYGVQRMLNALNKEVQVRKDVSAQKSQNQLTYMKGTVPYLNSKSFKVFLDKKVESSEDNVSFVKTAY